MTRDGQASHRRDNLIRINPPLTATVDEIRFVADTLISAIKSEATEA